MRRSVDKLDPGELVVTMRRDLVRDLGDERGRPRRSLDASRDNDDRLMPTH